MALVKWTEQGVRDTIRSITAAPNTATLAGTKLVYPTGETTLLQYDYQLVASGTVQNPLKIPLQESHAEQQYWFQVYALEGCSYSQRALSILSTLHKPYSIVQVLRTNMEAYKLYLAELTGATNAEGITFPQIFSNGIHVGGYQELCILLKAD